MRSHTVALNMSCPCTEMSAWLWLPVTETCKESHIIEYNFVVFWLNDHFGYTYTISNDRRTTQNFWTYDRSYSTNNTIEGSTNLASPKYNTYWKVKLKNKKKYVYFCTSVVYNLRSYFSYVIVLHLYFTAEQNISKKKDTYKICQF